MAPADSRSLLLAAGNLIRQLVFMIPKAQHVKQFIHVQRCVTEICSHLDVFLHCEVRDKVVLLEYVSQMFSAIQGQLLFVHVFDLLFRYGDTAAVRAVDPADDIEKSGFTAP